MYNKYKVSPKEQRTIDGITFASKKEMNRYKELKLLEKAGQISTLELQPKFLLQEEFVYKGKKIREIIYKADFNYYDTTKKSWIVEDVKGMKTKEYILKKKLLLFKYPNINFVEI